MANIKTITITDVTQPQINAAFIALTSATKGLEVDIKAVDSAWKAANKDLQQQIESIRRGTIVYSAGANINISSTGVISATVPTKTSQLQNDSGFITSSDVGDGTITIQRNGVDVKSFSMNQSSSDTVNITVPTELSDLTNDVGYITGDYIQPEIFFCTTAYNTATKTATSVQASTNFSLVDGRIYQVYVQNGSGGNSTTAVTMKLNNAPAIPVYLGNHVLAATLQSQLPSMLYYFVYHAATSNTEAYFRIIPSVTRVINAYQILGNFITVPTTQYGFNRNFVFILNAQTSIGASVTLTSWEGAQATAKIIINGNTTAGLSNPRTYFCYFHYDETNGHKVYTSTDWINFFGLTGDSGNAGKLNIQLYNRLTTYGSQYKSASTNSYGLDLSNSDIIGINGLYTHDTAGGYSEGINFYRDTTHNDSIYANGGHFYFGSNVQAVNSKGSETTGAQNSDATLHAASFVGNALYAPNFTFVIDSNAALAAWANATAGNDYTSVLIKKGEWSLSVTSSAIVINLTTAGTKVVVGEAGSKLILSGAVTGNKYGLNYSTRTYAPDCWMHNVNVTMTGGASNNRAYSGCGHLTNCTGTVTGGTTTALFYNCDFLEYCEGTASGGSSSNHVFQGCYGVRYCRGSAISSYYSLTANSTYAYANTLNGGWNTPL